MILDINYSDTIYGDTCIDERIDNELIREAAVYLISSEIFDEFNDEVLKRATELPIYIGVSLVSEDEIKDINREFRGIDKVTDVLSFPQFESVDELLDEIEGDEALVDIPLGDVVICLDQAERQSKEYGTSIRREVTYLLFIAYFTCSDMITWRMTKRPMRAHEERVMATLDILR